MDVTIERNGVHYAGQPLWGYNTEGDFAGGPQRIFIKFYKEIHDMGLIGALGAERWQTLSTLAMYVNPKGVVYPGDGELARKLGISEGAANKRISALLNFRFKVVDGQAAECERDDPDGSRIIVHSDEEGNEYDERPRTDKGQYQKRYFKILPLLSFGSPNGPKGQVESTCRQRHLEPEQGEEGENEAKDQEESTCRQPTCGSTQSGCDSTELDTCLEQEPKSNEKSARAENGHWLQQEIDGARSEVAIAVDDPPEEKAAVRESEPSPDSDPLPPNLLQSDVMAKVAQIHHDRIGEMIGPTRYEKLRFFFDEKGMSAELFELACDVSEMRTGSVKPVYYLEPILVDWLNVGAVDLAGVYEKDTKIIKALRSNGFEDKYEAPPEKEEKRPARERRAPNDQGINGNELAKQYADRLSSLYGDEEVG